MNAIDLVGIGLIVVGLATIAYVGIHFVSMLRVLKGIREFRNELERVRP